MYSILVRGSLGLLLCIVTGSPLHAQGRWDPDPRQAAIWTVMQFRTQLMEDRTPWDSCTVYEHAGRPDDFPAGLREPERGFLDRLEDPCGEREPVHPGALRIVRIDSLSISDSVSVVNLTIRKGHDRYRETYVLPALGRDTRHWGLQEVRTWGWVTFTPTTPRSS